MTMTIPCRTFGVLVPLAPLALRPEARPAAYTGQIMIAFVPAGARCVLTSTADAARVAEVTAPAEAALSRGTAAIEARCDAAGYVPVVLLHPVRDFAAGVHHAQPIGTGAVQNAIAVRTGSTRCYLDATIHLPPERFASAAERDAWFEARAAALRAAAAPWIARAERAPQAAIDTADVIRAQLAQDPAALETLRGEVGVAPEARGQ